MSTIQYLRPVSREANSFAFRHRASAFPTPINELIREQRTSSRYHFRSLLPPVTRRGPLHRNARAGPRHGGQTHPRLLSSQGQLPAAPSCRGIARASMQARSHRRESPIAKRSGIARSDVPEAAKVAKDAKVLSVGGATFATFGMSGRPAAVLRQDELPIAHASDLGRQAKREGSLGDLCNRAVLNQDPNGCLRDRLGAQLVRPELHYCAEFLYSLSPFLRSQSRRVAARRRCGSQDGAVASRRASSRYHSMRAMPSRIAAGSMTVAVKSDVMVITPARRAACSAALAARSAMTARAPSRPHCASTWSEKFSHSVVAPGDRQIVRGSSSLRLPGARGHPVRSEERMECPKDWIAASSLGGGETIQAGSRKALRRRHEQP